MKKFLNTFITQNSLTLLKIFIFRHKMTDNCLTAFKVLILSASVDQITYCISIFVMSSYVAQIQSHKIAFFIIIIQAKPVTSKSSF